MAAVAGGRLVVLPDVRRRHFPEQRIAFVAAGGGPGGRDERQAGDRRRGMTRRAHKARVLVVGDGKAADEKLADVDAVDRALVLFGIGRAHEEFAGGDTGEIVAGHETRQYSAAGRSVF